MRLCFDECVLDTDLRCLTRGGAEVPLSPKAFRLLEVLAERRPRAVPRHELRELVWPDTPMGGTTVARLVNEVRAAIGDDSRPPRLIRTIHRFGYAFCGPSTEDPAPLPASGHGYALRWGLRHFPLSPGENVIGRAVEAPISIASPKVSRRHARIVVSGEAAVLDDLGSRNGTYVGERRIEGPVDLRHGDQITVGPVLLIFLVSSAQETTSGGIQPWPRAGSTQ